MKYMGSKSRIAKYIVPIIQSYIDQNHIEYYIEPFVGGANVIDKISCKNKISDLNRYLIALLQHVQQGLPLYETVPKELYDKARIAFNNNDTSEFEDWEVGNIGFLASYNGRWFDGGFAKPVIEKTKNGERYRDYYREAKDNLLNQAISLVGITLKKCDYRCWNNSSVKNCVIYVDPPYENTKKYKNAESFEYNEFWDVMRSLSKNNIVLISELDAPDDFECIWSQEVYRTIKSDNTSKAVEKLFKYKEVSYGS